MNSNEPKAKPEVPGLAKPEFSPAERPRQRRKRGRGLSIRSLLTITAILSIFFAVVRQFRGHIELLIGSTILFLVTLAIGLAFVAARRKAALQQSFLALIAASRRAGLPVEAGARAFARECGNRKYRNTLIRFSNEVRQGMAMPDAVVSVRGLIPPDQRASFRAIEATSGSERAFARLVEVRNAMIEALNPPLNMIFYFLSLTIQIVSIVSFIIYFIYPKFEAICTDFGIPLLSTSNTLLIMLSDALIKNTLGIRLGLALVSIAAFIYLVFLSRSGNGLGLFGMFVPFLTTGERAMVLRGLAEAFRSQTPLDETLRVFADWSLRGLARRRCRLARQAMISGVDWVDALAAEGLLRRCEVPLAHASIRAGNTGDTLEALADSIQSRQWYRWRLTANVASPAMTIAASLVVLLVCWTFFSPLLHIIRRLAS